MTDYIGHSPIAFPDHQGKVVLRSLIADGEVTVPLNVIYAIDLGVMLINAAMEEIKREPEKGGR